jgi:hypothetical protein
MEIVQERRRPMLLVGAVVLSGVGVVALIIFGRAIGTRAEAPPQHTMHVTGRASRKVTSDRIHWEATVCAESRSALAQRMNAIEARARKHLAADEYRWGSIEEEESHFCLPFTVAPTDPAHGTAWQRDLAPHEAADLELRRECSGEEHVAAARSELARQAIADATAQVRALCDLVHLQPRELLNAEVQDEDPDSSWDEETCDRVLGVAADVTVSTAPAEAARPSR